MKQISFFYEAKINLERSESPIGKCAKLPTVAASNNRDLPTMLLYYCLFAPHVDPIPIAHIPFVVNRIFNTALTERLQ